MNTATLEQPVAQSREVARLFVPKVPVPDVGATREAKEAWGSWIWFVRRFAERGGVGRVGVPCRVEATVRLYEAGRRRLDTGRAMVRWYMAIEDATERELVADAELLRGLEVRYEAVDPATPLTERPGKEGVEIVVMEADGWQSSC